MISDNTVHGDNIYLRELQNFFFEVLGMMSITHYGAIGDGRTDNYGPLQVAIDDAHRRGLSFLYVPYGRYIYTGELINIGDLIFMGNPHAHIVNIRTGEEIRIYQFGWYGGEGDFYTKEESDGRFVAKAGDTMTGPLAIGSTCVTSGELSFAQGEGNVASGVRAFAIGHDTTASGGNAFASGLETVASGNNSHAEGCATVASGTYAHAEGSNTVASGVYAHAENGNTIASGAQSHAEGWNSQATYNSCHAEGTGSYACNQAAHAEGYGTTARGTAQHAEGMWNVVDTTAEENTAQHGTYLHILGNGANSSNRSNAHTIDWGGNAWFSGDVYVSSTSGTNRDEGSKKLATQEYVDNLISEAGVNYFKASIAPTVWNTTVTANTDYTTTDGYGLWEVFADNSAGNDWSITNAFDGNNNTEWKSDDVSFGDSVHINIDFPILIKPSELKLVPTPLPNPGNLWTAEIQGKNADDTYTTLWTTEIPHSLPQGPLLCQIYTTSWYKGLRAILTRPHGTSNSKVLISGLEISKGFWKEMN